MRFLADECRDEATVAALRHDGHDVVYAVESLRGAPDEEVLARAVSEQRILLTEDKDFGEVLAEFVAFGELATGTVREEMASDEHHVEDAGQADRDADGGHLEHGHFVEAEALGAV